MSDAGLKRTDRRINRFALILAIVLAAPGILPAQTNVPAVDWAAVHETTMRGLSQLYNLEVDSSLQTFDAVRTMAPGDPRGPFFKSMVHFYIYGLNRNEKELSTFLDESEEVISICEKLLDQNEHDAISKFYLGGIYGYRGMAYQTDGSILKAARDGRKGYLLLEDAVRDDPHMYDAQMGFGLFRYLLAKLPKSMSYVLSILGFEGDLEGGLRSLRLAAERGVYTRVEAKLFLSQFLFNEGRQDTALQYLDELRHEYPENTLFLVLYAFWQNRLGNLDVALDAARTAVALNDQKKVRYGEELIYSTMGSILFTKNNFTEAANYYRLYLGKVKDDERIPGLTYYRAGVACEIAGDRATALRFFGKLKNGNGADRSWNGYYYRKGRELLERPLGQGEILNIEGANALTQKQYASAHALFRRAVEVPDNSTDVRARALYGVEQAQFESGDLAGALETAGQVTSLTPANETWIIPHALFIMGETLARLGRINEARSAYEKAKSYDDYDFQNHLEGEISEALKKLDGGAG